MSEAQQPYLRIEDLTKQFGEFVAVRELSLEINGGEFVCFLGPSGCGKTTPVSYTHLTLPTKRIV